MSEPMTKEEMFNLSIHFHEPIGFRPCNKCGALVADHLQDKHYEWHQND